MAPIDIILGLALWTKGLPPSLNELKEATLALGTSTLRERAAWSATSADFPLHLGSTASSSTKVTKASRDSKASKAAKATQAASRSSEVLKDSKPTDAVLLMSEED